MEDILLLKQKLEFMQLELDDAKSREAQLKSMYDSMLRSFSYDSPRLTASSSVELKSAEEKHTQERLKIKIKYKEKIRNLEKKVTELKEINCNLDEKLSEQEGNFNISKNILEKEIIILKEQKREVDYKMNEATENLTRIIERKNENISKLKEELEEVKREAADEISKITEGTNKSILELKAIYEQEKPMRRSLDDSVTYEKLKYEFQSLQEIIKNLENSEYNLKEQLRYKDEQIEKITRKLRVKASEDSKDPEITNLMKIKESLSEKLIDKEIEISKLKKIIGDLKLEITYGACKPPIYSPKSLRSMTFINKSDSPSPEPSFFEKQEEYKQLKQYERMINQCSVMECENCGRTFQTNTFYDHILNCQLEDSLSKSQNFADRNSLEKVQDLEKQIEILKLALGKLKNQRDKAKIESEKLLMQLKQVKLEWALSEESYDEKIMEIKKELKNAVEILYRIRRSVNLTPDITFEVDLSFQNTDRFFGGRLTKSFAGPPRLFNY
ncbi:hypothetical protein SteCoe_9080 [Stentor coeruleus]|uniref:Uncharacterized protein n=1 Tax=Stentor coeruleus TaxID=5963 RepID=A0A1R2CIV2_9CILI|nr:hypothetical protein SteCoe_9080 [Stentor coeruleus]